jgi:hypothetical protein
MGTRMPSSTLLRLKQILHECLTLAVPSSHMQKYKFQSLMIVVLMIVVLMIVVLMIVVLTNHNQITITCNSHCGWATAGSMSTGCAVEITALLTESQQSIDRWLQTPLKKHQGVSDGSFTCSNHCGWAPVPSMNTVAAVGQLGRAAWWGCWGLVSRRCGGHLYGHRRVKTRPNRGYVIIGTPSKSRTCRNSWLQTL